VGAVEMIIDDDDDDENYEQKAGMNYTL